MNFKALAGKILSEVGGKNNIESVTHCATRLRFIIANLTKVNRDAIKNIKGVITIVEVGGQFQVVIGPNVSEVYKEIMKYYNDDINSRLSSDKVGEYTHKEKQTILTKFIDLVSSIFAPFIGILAGAGMIKGFLIILVATNLLDKAGSTYEILYVISDSIFYFLPIILAIPCAKKFNTNSYVSVGVACSLLYPSIIHLSSLSNQHLTFLGIPLVLMNYTQTVIPIIISVYFMSKLDKLLKIYIPEIIQFFFNPALLLLITVPVTLIFIGPITVYTSHFIAMLVIEVFKISPTLAGIILGSSWQVLVMFGLHWGIIPVMLNNIATYHYDPSIAAILPTVFAQSGACLAVMFKTKNSELRKLSGSASVSAFLGITEPAMYGVTLKLKKPFIICIIVSGVCGGIIAGFKAMVFGFMAIPGLFMIPSLYPSGVVPFIASICAIIGAFIGAFTLTYILGLKKDSNNN